MGVRRRAVRERVTRAKKKKTQSVAFDYELDLLKRVIDAAVEAGIKDMTPVEISMAIEKLRAADSEAKV
jgi:hypothetical protein